MHVSKKQTIDSFNIQYLTMECTSQSSLFLNLPEEVLRMILANLQDHEIYFDVREACRQLKYLAESLVRIGRYGKGKFLLVPYKNGIYRLYFLPSIR